MKLETTGRVVRNCVLGLAAVFFPCAPLFDRDRGFGVDWPNHVWMVGYYGEHVRQHGSFPTAFHTDRAAGIAYPVFYGYLFYPLLGLAATHLHPEVVVRAAVVLLFAAQYVSVRTTARRLNAAEGLATAFACLTVWSVYALTNLYNRSALTELFAAGALVCAVCAWFDLLGAPTRGAGWRRGLRFGLLVTLAVGFHPITGLYLLPVLAVLLAAMPARRAPLGRVLGPTAAAGLAAVAVLAPWVYAVRRFGKKLGIEGDSNAVVDLRAWFDRWQTRLNPLPYDWRCNADAPPQVSTPYLDAQIGLPLLILAAAVAALAVRQTSGRGRVAAVAFLVAPVGYAAAMLALSLNPAAFDHLPAVCAKVQFLYRLVAFVNLGLLLVPLFALAWLARRQPGAPPVAVPPTLLCFVLTYAGFCVLLKLQHAVAVPGNVWPVATAPGHAGAGRWVKTAADRDALTRLPISMYGTAAYTTPGLLRPADGPPAALTPLKVEAFGQTPPLAVTLDRPGYIWTDALVFPWNRFAVDGQPVPTTDLRAHAGVFTAVPVPAGTHTVEYRFEPDRTWQTFHRVSQPLLALWVFAVGGSCAAQLARARQSNEPKSSLSSWVNSCASPCTACGISAA